MRSRILYVLSGVFLSFFGAFLVTSPASASVATATTLTSGKAVQGKVTSSNGVDYTFTGVAGRHVTLAITNPKVAPSGNSLQINAYDASDANLAGTTFSTGPNFIDFTPTASEAGKITVAITPYNSGATGTFTLTYSTDVTGTLTSATPVNGTLSYQGQNADYTFTGVAGQHVTLAITNPVMTIPGTNLQINAYDTSGANLGSTTFSTGPAFIDFTPTSDETGKITVVISQYNSGATGSFTLTYATDVTGTLTSGTPVNGTLSYQGQNADYTFSGVAGRHVTLAITNPEMTLPGTSLQINAYDASGGNLDSATFSTGPTYIDFAPTSSEAGTITVVISQYNSGATGSFTLTYATDVTGTLKSGTPVNGALKYQGQNADYTFTGVAGRAVTLEITNPKMTLPDTSLQINAYDASDANLAGTTFSTSATGIDFTPTSSEAGTITVVISQYNSGATGSFTLTYTAG
jgi:hypothetical protein